MHTHIQRATLPRQNAEHALAHAKIVKEIFKKTRGRKAPAAGAGNARSLACAEQQPVMAVCAPHILS